MALKKLHTWAAVLGIGLLAAAAWWLQRDKPSAAAAADGGAAPRMAGASGPAAGAGPVVVEVAKAETMRIEDEAQAVGSLRAMQTVMIRPEVAGRVVRIGFKDGERVRRGQLLVQLDDQLQRAQLQQAQAQASIARTNLQRSRDLVAQNFVSQSAVDQNLAALEVAAAQVALARAQLARLAINAPFDGVTGIKAINLGDYLKDGADIVALEDRSKLWVDFRLPERFAGMVKAGQTVGLALDALPGRNFVGTVDALDSTIDSNGRSLLVRARIDQPAPELKSGMFARSRVVFAVRENAVVVPEEALVPQAGKQYLYKAIDAPPAAPASAADNGSPGPAGQAQGPRKVAQRIEARLGLRLAGKVEILEGVKAGDLIVTAGHQRIAQRADAPLRIVDLSRPASEGGGRAPGKKPEGAASAPRIGAPA